MIVLTVISFNGAPSSGPSASFDELGGSIGRADHNQLVLPDPERTISRVHARILYRNGGYAIVDNGSNPISVNGRPAGAGIELPLRPGDQIEIGAYKLAVTDGAAARSDDPFASLFGTGLAGEDQAPGSVPVPPAPARAAAPAPAAPPRAAGGPAALPDDWDPFAPDAGLASMAPAADPLGGGLTGFVPQAPSEASLDDLFGLAGGPTPADPLAGAVPAAPSAPLPDPLRALARPAPPPATAGNQGSELNTPMPLPAAARPAPRPGTPSGAIFSWDETPVSTQPSVQRRALPPQPPLRPQPQRPPQASAAPAPSEAAGGDALLAAFLDGLGMPELPLTALDENTVRLVGQLLRESTRGTVELLVARAALKREMRADVTMIAARQNNPLKFSPTVEVALQHLLGPPVGGFMPAGRAMRDAYDDLRAHQLGVMAGMRAALDGVLQRFDPAQLEAKLVRRSALANLIPAARKARLWELFQELFTQLQGEAQDDFDDLFGKAFLRAYEEQLERLQREPGEG